MGRSDSEKLACYVTYRMNVSDRILTSTRDTVSPFSFQQRFVFNETFRVFQDEPIAARKKERKDKREYWRPPGELVDYRGEVII